MKLISQISNEDYVPGKFERLWEKNLVAYLERKGIKLLKIIKYGHSENAPTFTLKYDVYVEHTTEDVWDDLYSDLALEYCYTEDTIDAVNNYIEEDTTDVFSFSFWWSTESKGVLEESCKDILDLIGENDNKTLYNSTYFHLKKGICWGELEVLIAK